MSHLTIILQLLGSLALLLYGLELLSSSLKKIDHEKIIKFLLKFSKTPARGLLSGAITTGLIGSSSVMVIILIAFIDSNLISFSNSIAVVLGANIGTTISSQIIAFDIGEYATITLFIGVLGNLFSKKEQTKFYFNIVCGISLIFYGLYLMEITTLPYRDSPEILRLMKDLKNPFYGALIGAFITAIIQSSSATIGVTIVLVAQGMLNLEGGIAIMLGAEIGTCVDTLIATIGRKKEAIKLGLFHLAFNITAVSFWLIFFTSLVDITTYVSTEDASPGRKLANAHLLFNLLSVLIYFTILALYKNIHSGFFLKKNN